MNTAEIIIRHLRSTEKDDCNQREVKFDLGAKSLSIEEDGKLTNKMYPKNFRLMAELIAISDRYNHEPSKK